MKGGALFALLLAAAPEARAAELLLSLEVALAERPDLVVEAAPKRFVLLEDGTLYVGGTEGLASGRLEKSELKDLLKGLERVRKTPGLGASVAFGEGSKRYRLVASKGKPLDVVMTGEPATAPSALKPLASFVADLTAFRHPSLRPYQPAQYSLRAREANLVGGCRHWSFPLPIERALAGAQPLPAAEAVGWPTGAQAASVCANDRRYAVTLKPLLPWEQE